MKLRYYLRGLGIGIVVTAIIMSFTRQPEKLTDAQIKMRALELGMVEESVLADLQEKEEMASSEEDNIQGEIPAFEDIVEVETEDTNSEDENDSKTEESSEAENDSKTEGSSEAENDSKIEESSGTEADSLAEEEESENINIESGNSNDGVDTNDNFTEIPSDEVVENYIVISVEGGNDSFTVSEKLYEAGLINSSVEFNQYLVRNGYDRKLRVGDHEIPADATEEDMAKILCGMK